MGPFATPALETPSGHIVVLVVGLFFALGLWQNRSAIDLLFFRLSGGSARVGNLAAIVVPVAVFATTCFIVAKYL